MDQSEKPPGPYALKADEGWVYRFGIDFTVKASEIQAGSGVGIIEYVTKKGEEPPDHTNPTENEMFYVLEGALTFRCGGERFELERGDFIFLPRGIPHGYTIQGQETIRLLVITSPVRKRPRGGWGGFVADLETDQGELIRGPGKVG